MREEKKCIAGKPVLKSLDDFEAILRKIRIANLEGNKETLDIYFSEFYAAVMKSDGDGYKMQSTAFTKIVRNQYAKIARSVTLACDSFEDVMQCVMAGIYDGSLFFRGLPDYKGELYDKRLKKILNTNCCWQVVNYICDFYGKNICQDVRRELGLPKNRHKIVVNGETIYKYASKITTIDESGFDSCDDKEPDGLSREIQRQLSYDPIGDRFAAESRESDPLETVAVKLAYIFYETITKYKYDEQDAEDILRYSHQVMDDNWDESLLGKKLTFSSLPVAERFFKQTIHDANFLGKALKKLTPEEMEKFGEQIDAILDGTDNYITRKKLLIACFAYIKEKREEVAYAS